MSTAKAPAAPSDRICEKHIITCKESHIALLLILAMVCSANTLFDYKVEGGGLYLTNF